MSRELVGLIAAMPEELRPLLARYDWRRERVGRFPAYRFTTRDTDVVVLQSGMGMRNAAEATAALAGHYRPTLLLNIGFAGAVAPGLSVGDVVVANQCLQRLERLFTRQQGLDIGLAEQAAAILAPQAHQYKVVVGTFITASGILVKQEVLKQLPNKAPFPVLEMESAAVAMTAMREDIALVAIRSISDDAKEELQFSIEEFTDRQMRIRFAKVLLCLARKPQIIPQLFRLSRNCKIAGENLAASLQLILDHLPANAKKL